MHWKIRQELNETGKCLDLKTFKMWEMAANSVGGGGVSMPADVIHGKKKKKNKNEIVKREKLKNAKNS